MDSINFIILSQLSILNNLLRIKKIDMYIQ